MNRDKIYFVVGLLIGIGVAVLFLQYFAPRYSTVKTGETVIKQDRWTGQSWRYVDEQWKAIVGRNYDWEKIDKALRDALQVPFAKVDTDSALKLLRERHPTLKALSDEDLLERIKVVYSKQILCNLYLDSFLKTEQGETGKKGD
ncbi:MAG: hypothetical protein V1758_09980 [Pseudomonadota bacterium]